ncbi:MAG: hypothetical protein ACRDIC_01595 [bacterium]
MQRPQFIDHTYGAVLLVSMDQQKTMMWDRDRRRELIAKVVPSLRCLPGVRHVEAVLFQDWKDAAGKPAPWMPNGALIFVQAGNPQKLEMRIQTIFGAAAGLDQEMIVMERLGDLDSM